jgi:glycosyltransferase involved in cell wall biosynthesis
MKILVVSTWLPYPLDNGSRVRAFYLLRHLSRRHTITLLSFGEPDLADDLADLQEFCEQIEVIRPIYREFPWYRGFLAGTPRHFGRVDNFEMRTRVAAQISRHDAAVALQVDAARYLAEWPNIPRVFEEAEVTLFKERYERAPDWKHRVRDGVTWWKFRRFIRHLIGGFERTTVVSRQEREHLRDLGCDPSRIDVVPNGVEVTATVRPATRVNRLIYPGSVMYSANLDAVSFFAHEVWPAVRAVRPDLSFWITGATDGVDVAEVARVPGVRFTGRLPSVESVIAESVVCVVPLRMGGGTRLKVLQAMALGTPIVSTTKGVEGLELEPGTHALVGDTAVELAQHVLRLLDQPLLAAHISAEASRLVAERYSWTSAGAELERTLERAVVERHA